MSKRAEHIVLDESSSSYPRHIRRSVDVPLGTRMHLGVKRVLTSASGIFPGVHLRRGGARLVTYFQPQSLKLIDVLVVEATSQSSRRLRAEGWVVVDDGDVVVVGRVEVFVGVGLAVRRQVGPVRGVVDVAVGQRQTVAPMPSLLQRQTDKVERLVFNDRCARNCFLIIDVQVTYFLTVDVQRTVFFNDRCTSNLFFNGRCASN